jgi:hypothetical protein
VKLGFELHNQKASGKNGFPIAIAGGELTKRVDDYNKEKSVRTGRDTYTKGDALIDVIGRWIVLRIASDILGTFPLVHSHVVKIQ